MFRINILPAFISGSILLLCSCGNKDKDAEERIFELLDPAKTGINFVNTIPEHDTLSNYIYIYNGNGVAAGDINNDGLQDILFTGNSTPAKLYLNKGNFTFEDITEKAGLKTGDWMTGVTMADVNNDGYQDIYICKSGPEENPGPRNNLLFINNKNLTFTEKGRELGVDDPGNSTCGTFLDYDSDGDLDLYVGNHEHRYFSDINVPFSRTMRLGPHNQQHLYRNDGAKFTDVSDVSGVKAMGYCLSATPGDFNRDGKMDLYVCNDYQVPDYYYLNNGDGTFTESNNAKLKHTSANSMGSDAGDYNNDGWLDLITVDMLPNDPRRFMLLQGPRDYDFFTLSITSGYGYQYMHNSLQTNCGDGSFRDLAFLNGVARTDWSWSPLFADFDNDGFTDIFITNGYYRDITNQDFILYQQRTLSQKKKGIKTKEILDKLPLEKLSNYAYKNKGNYQFDNMTEKWGLELPTQSTGSCYADLNNDGHLDLIICNQGAPAQIYKNVGSKGNYLKVKCEGNKSNRFGIGCKVLVQNDSSVHLFEMQQTHGYQSSSPAELNIGAGQDKSLKKITIIWPSGTYQELNNVKTNQLLTVKESDAKGQYDYTEKPTYTFEEITSSCGVSFMHEDQDNPDFKREPLLPHRFTQLGPGAASGDVNGDGLTDLFITNARESKGCRLFIQSAGGKFSEASSQPWNAMNDVDVLGCLLFDADDDGDNDLYLAAGGAEFMWPSAKYKHRLYMNDGKGNFSDHSAALPDINCSGSCICAGDIDADGDLDLFVAGRLNPGNYPKAPARSYLLRNQEGQFVDVTENWLPDIKKASPMICAAIFADYTGDNKPDLILAGEWMAPTFFENKGDKFLDKTQSAGTLQLQGWYNSLLAFDADNDGDLDIIAGNKGMNSFVQASAENPIKLYWADLDANGSQDLWMTYTKDQNEYPLYQLDEMASSYPGFMRKRFTTYSAIASKPAKDIFGVENMKNSLVAHNFASLLLRNNGGQFEAIPLPRMAQASPIFGLLSMDVDRDGLMDVIGIGNSYAPRVTHGRDDAGTGFVLLGRPGGFTFVDSRVSGLKVTGDAKSLIVIPLAHGGQGFVATENKGPARVYKTHHRTTFVPAMKSENKALVQLKNGKTRAENTTFGSGYLGGGQPGVWADEQVVSITFINSRGNKRVVKNSPAI